MVNKYSFHEQGPKSFVPGYLLESCADEIRSHLGIDVLSDNFTRIINKGNRIRTETLYFVEISGSTVVKCYLHDYAAEPYVMKDFIRPRSASMKELHIGMLFECNTSDSDRSDLFCDLMEAKMLALDFNNFLCKRVSGKVSILLEDDTSSAMFKFYFSELFQ